MEEYSSGCILQIQNGAKLQVKNLGYIDINDGGSIRNPVKSHTSLTLALDPHGASIITAATSGKAQKVVFTIGTPKEGMRKQIVQGCTFAQMIRGSSVAKTVYFGTTGKLLLTIPKTTKGVGNTCVELMALSTVRWSIIQRSTAGINAVTVTTACT